MYWFRCFKCTEYQLKVLSDQHWTVYSSEHELNFVIHPFSGCLSEILQFCIKIEKNKKPDIVSTVCSNMNEWKEQKAKSAKKFSKKLILNLKQEGGVFQIL